MKTDIKKLLKEASDEFGEAQLALAEHRNDSRKIEEKLRSEATIKWSKLSSLISILSHEE